MEVRGRVIGCWPFPWSAAWDGDPGAGMWGIGWTRQRAETDMKSALAVLQAEAEDSLGEF